MMKVIFLPRNQEVLEEPAPVPRRPSLLRGVDGDVIKIVQRAVQIKAPPAAKTQDAGGGAAAFKLFLGQILLCRTNLLPRGKQITQEQREEPQRPPTSEGGTTAAPPPLSRFDAAKQSTDACWEGCTQTGTTHTRLDTDKPTITTAQLQEPKTEPKT